MRLNNKIYWIATCLLFISCHSSDIIDKVDTPKRIVVVYMLADNNLDYFAVQDLNEMEAGFPKNTEDKLVVYVDRGRNGQPSHPYLMEIVHDESDQIVSPIIQSFAEQNSADAQVLKSILDQTFAHYEKKNFTSKGLVMWSHGNAWLPNGVSILTNRDKILEDENKNKVSLKSFGLDDVPEESNMDIKEMANVLSNYHFDFLSFDACFMSAIEVIYELKDVADYMISSPAEILSSGFPYRQVVPLFFKENLDVNQIAQAYFEDYNNKSGLLKSASIAVIKMDEISTLTEKIRNFSASVSSQSIVKKNVLQLDRFDGEWIYDLKDFLAQTTQKQPNLQSQYEQIIQQWNKTIVYENHTEFMVNQIDLKKCNGISTYIPDDIHEKKINDYYKTLSWFKASGYDQIFTDI